MLGVTPSMYLVGESGAVHFQNASFVIGRRHEFGQDQLFNVRFTHGAGDDLFPEGFQLVNVPDGNGSFAKMVFGPYSAAVVNGNIRMGGLLNGLAEKGAYGDVRDFFSGDAHLLVEKRIPENRRTISFTSGSSGISSFKETALVDLERMETGCSVEKIISVTPTWLRLCPVWLSRVPVLR